MCKFTPKKILVIHMYLYCTENIRRKILIKIEYKHYKNIEAK